MRSRCQEQAKFDSQFQQCAQCRVQTANAQHVQVQVPAATTCWRLWVEPLGWLHFIHTACRAHRAQTKTVMFHGRISKTQPKSHKLFGHHPACDMQSMPRRRNMQILAMQSERERETRQPIIFTTCLAGKHTFYFSKKPNHLNPKLKWTEHEQMHC